METLLIVVTLFIVLDVVALRWGFDSTEKIDSPEWERRATRHIPTKQPGPWSQSPHH